MTGTPSILAPGPGFGETFLGVRAGTGDLAREIFLGLSTGVLRAPNSGWVRVEGRDERMGILRPERVNPQGVSLGFLVTRSSSCTSAEPVMATLHFTPTAATATTTTTNARCGSLNIGLPFVSESREKSLI